MKKKFFMAALCLPLGLLQAQNMLTNGGFETYSTLPTTCPTLGTSAANTISDVNNWSASSTTWKWDYPSGCGAGNCFGGQVYGRAYYYNSTTGGNGSCEPVAANSGTGYLLLQSHGVFLPDMACHNGVNEFAYQSLSGTTLYASNQYTFSGYVYLNGTNHYTGDFLTAYLTTGTTIASGSGTSISVSGSGWISFTVTLTVPSDGSSYNLVIGSSNFCSPADNGYFYYILDDLALTQAPCVGSAGPNKSNGPQCCGTPCPGTNVQIGTAGLSGLSYAWTCDQPNCYLSSTTVATPTASPCTAPSTTVYSVTVSGPGCITTTYSMSVGTHTVHPCCRMENPAAPEKESIDKHANFTVFPNPASSQVTVSLSKSLGHLRIIDISGKIIYDSKDVSAGDLKIDVSRYAKGVYFILGESDAGIEKQKFIIE